MEKVILDQLTTLGHPQRLALFRLLMRRYPDALAAGEIATALDLPASTLSAYLSRLMRAGLITQDRHATSLHYRIDMTAVQRAFQYLSHDCCNDRPILCPPAPLTASNTLRVLFLCTGNAARSIMAEAILRSKAGNRFSVFSAGTKPLGQIAPAARTLLAQNGHDIAALGSKSLATLQHANTVPFDFIFTVCDRAANEDAPPWPGHPLRAHWGLPDPLAEKAGTTAQTKAIEDTYNALQQRIHAFVTLPFDTLPRSSLQAALDDIAHILPPTRKPTQ